MHNSEVTIRSKNIKYLNLISTIKKLREFPVITQEELADTLIRLLGKSESNHLIYLMQKTYEETHGNLHIPHTRT